MILNIHINDMILGIFIKTQDITIYTNRKSLKFGVNQNLDKHTSLK